MNTNNVNDAEAEAAAAVEAVEAEAAEAAEAVEAEAAEAVEAEAVEAEAAEAAEAATAAASTDANEKKLVESKELPGCCVIGLCVYNNQLGLPSVLSNIVKIIESCLFEKLTVVAFYDNSSDKSYSILDVFKTKYENVCATTFKMIIVVNKPNSRNMRMDFGGGSNAISRVLDTGRTARIAVARNGILHVIRGLHSRGFLNKYFIMMDCNEYACVGKINIPTLRSALERSDEWDSVSFNREAGYYDYWALSYDPYIYSIYHVRNRNETLHNMKEYFEQKLKYASESVKNDKKYSFIPVYSSYNGFAIYKTDKFLNCSYSSNIDIRLFPKKLLPPQISNKFTNDCEHRKFHLEAIKKNEARIVVSPLSIFYKLPIRNPRLRGPA